MVDRKLVLLGIVLFIALVGLTLDPLNLRARYAPGNPGSEEAVTGMFVGGNALASVVPGILFLIVIGLFYAVWRNQNPEE